MDKLADALKRPGFDCVFDTNFSTDLTTYEGGQPIHEGAEMAASRGSQLWKPDASAGIRFSHDTVNAVEKKYEHLFSRRTDGPPLQHLKSTSQPTALRCGRLGRAAFYTGIHEKADNGCFFSAAGALNSYETRRCAQHSNPH